MQNKHVLKYSKDICSVFLGTRELSSSEPHMLRYEY